jgi:hypothetical protein
MLWVNSSRYQRQKYLTGAIFPINIKNQFPYGDTMPIKNYYAKREDVHVRKKTLLSLK